MKKKNIFNIFAFHQTTEAIVEKQLFQVDQ